MHIIRFSANGRIKYGTIESEMISSYRGSPFSAPKDTKTPFEPDGNKYSINKVKLLAPCSPSKIVCLGLNYRRHAEELKAAIPSVPLLFLKPSTTIIGPEAKIMLPHRYTRVDYEGELGVVIGTAAKEVTETEAANFILGYTCLNDVTERHIQKEDGQWTRAKSFDTFAPIGPCIQTTTDPDNLKLETYLNGNLRQSIRTSDLIFEVPELVSFISGVMTLLPGDIIATGTPSGIGPMAPGDMIEIKIDTIGTLRNFVSEHN